MKTTLMIGLVAIVLLAGCAKSAPQDNRGAILQKMLDLDEVTANAQVQGRTATITYDTATGTEYDQKLIADWGMMMGAASNIDIDTIVINNMVGTTKMATLTTTQQNVLAFQYGTKNESAFWSDVQITD